MRYQHRQSGIVLILTILIIASALATATLFGNLIIRQIRQSQLIDQSIQAYYIAESGTEHALYQIRKLQAVTSCGNGGACSVQGYCVNDPTVPCIAATQDPAAPVLPSAGNGWQTTVNKQQSFQARIDRGGALQLDLFDSAELQGAGVTDITVQELDSRDSNGNTGSTDVKLYAELTNVTKVLGIPDVPGSSCQTQSNASVVRDFVSLTQADVPAYTATIAALDEFTAILQQCSYVFKLTHPLNTNLDWVDVDVSVFNGVNQVPIPSRLEVISAANYGVAHQQITVKTPLRPPLSGLYDFVLFSNSSITH